MIKAVLVWESKGKQYLIYCVSHALRDAKTQYPNLEKFAYALVIANQKLQHYFQDRVINIYTNQLLKKVFHKPNIWGSLVAWAIDLS